MKTALLWLMLNAHTTARFNVTAQVIFGCRVDVEVVRVWCANTEAAPRTMVAGGCLWVVF